MSWLNVLIDMTKASFAFADYSLCSTSPASIRGRLLHNFMFPLLCIVIGGPFNRSYDYHTGKILS